MKPSHQHTWKDLGPVHAKTTPDANHPGSAQLSVCTVCFQLGVRRRTSNRKSKIFELCSDSPFYKVAFERMEQGRRRDA